MIINTKTLGGAALTINVADSTLTIPQGQFEYDGPVVIVHDNRPTAALKFKLDGQSVHALISNETRDTIYHERVKIAGARLESLFPGLALLKTVHHFESAYLEAFAKMMEDEHNDGVSPPKAPARNADELSALYPRAALYKARLEAVEDELSALYPRAALYLRAESYVDASNVDKHLAGQRAMKTLMNGGSENEVKDILDDWTRDLND